MRREGGRRAARVAGLATEEFKEGRGDGTPVHRLDSDRRGHRCPAVHLDEEEEQGGSWAGPNRRKVEELGQKREVGCG